MTNADTPAERRNGETADQPPARKPWRSPRFAALADLRDTAKPHTTTEVSLSIGPS